MTARQKWDETRALIEAGWHSGWVSANLCGNTVNLAAVAPSGARGSVCEPPPQRLDEIDWDDIKRAEADADRMLYGGMFTPQRED